MQNNPQFRNWCLSVGAYPLWSAHPFLPNFYGAKSKIHALNGQSISH